MYKYTHICNIPDFKDENGKWVKSYNPIPYECHHTRAGRLWMNINSRCKVGGVHQKKHPTYVGCKNGFKDFQEFAEWCQHQYGYLNKEKNGYYWQLDKDLVEYENNVYCKEKCLFVPARINLLLVAKDNARGEYPLGVYWRKDVSKFQAQCSIGSSKNKTLGLFIDSFEAHQAWQKYKIYVMKNILLTDEEVTHHLKLVQIIEQHIQRLEDDLNNNQETF